MLSELSHGKLRMGPVMHALLAKEHVSSGCLPPLCMSWERWLTHEWSRVAVYLSIFRTFWMNIWLWVTSTARASLQSSKQDIAEVRRRDPCCQLPTSFLWSVGSLHVSEFWSPHSSICLSLALCLCSVAAPSSHLSCLRIRVPPEISCLL